MDQNALIRWGNRLGVEAHALKLQNHFSIFTGHYNVQRRPLAAPAPGIIIDLLVSQLVNGGQAIASNMQQVPARRSHYTLTDDQ